MYKITMQRLIMDRPQEAPQGWLVQNAPRPMRGTNTWIGEFKHGVLWAALDKRDQYSASWYFSNVSDDGWITEFVSMEQARAEVAEYYRANYQMELEPDTPERDIITAFYQHCSRSEVDADQYWRDWLAQ